MKNIHTLSNNELTSRLVKLISNEKAMQIRSIVYLQEVASRKLYAELGFSSLFTFCVKHLGLSEGATYRRIEAMKAVAKFPDLLVKLERGVLSLTALSVIGRVLTATNKDKITNSIKCKSIREIERIVSQFKTGASKKKKDIIKFESVERIKSVHVNKAVEPRVKNSCAKTEDLKTTSLEKLEIVDGNEGIIEEKSEVKVKGYYRVHSSFSEDTMQKVEQVKSLLSNAGLKDLDGVVNAALSFLIDAKSPQKKEARRQKRLAKKKQKEEQASGKEIKEVNTKSTDRKGKESKNPISVPKSVKDKVFVRDGGVCTYCSKDGTRCGSNMFLEVDHIKPRALGGSNNIENLQLLCRTHNQMRAEQTFGKFVLQ